MFHTEDMAAVGRMDPRCARRGPVQRCRYFEPSMYAGPDGVGCMSGILKGMRVVEGSAFVAVPLAGMTLAQMGADVIRFDRVEGGLDAGRWPVAPSGRKHVLGGHEQGQTVDCHRHETPARARDHLGTDLRTGRRCGPVHHQSARARLDGLRNPVGPAAPDLCMVTLTGDRAGRPAVDYTVNPALGFPMATGPEGSTEPVAHALPAWDCIAGNMVVSALLAAERKALAPWPRLCGRSGAQGCRRRKCSAIWA